MKIATFGTLGRLVGAPSICLFIGFPGFLSTLEGREGGVPLEGTGSCPSGVLRKGMWGLEGGVSLGGLWSGARGEIWGR